MEAQKRLERIAALLGMGRLDDAQREALEGVAAFPDVDRLWAALATVENRRADFPAAVYAADRALSLNPENLHALHSLGPAYFHTERPDDARRAMDDVVALAPEWPAGLVQRSSVYSWTAKNDADKAIVRENGRRALELDPENAETYGLVAEAHRFIGDNAIAARLIDDGLGIAPTSESLLLKKARFGGLSERETAVVIRSILAVNPLNVHALRLLHFATWRRLIRLAAWPGIVGALSAALAYSYFLHGGADGARVWLGILLFPAAIVWGSMFLSLRAVAPRERLAGVFRGAPVGLLGFVLTAVASVATVVEIAALFAMPLRDAGALAGILTAVAATVLALAAGDVLMRVGAARSAGRTGLFGDNPEGRLSARYAARGQGNGTFGRLVTVAIVLFALVAGAWMPGATALASIAAALTATVLARAGANAQLRGRRRAAVWFTLTGAAALTALVLVPVRMG